MTDNWRKKILFSFVFIASVYSSNGCWMEGVDIWALQQSTTILDTFRGAVFDRATRDIDSITSFSFMDGLNAGPYLTVTHSDSRFIIATNDAFEDYEEYETKERISVTVNFRCSGGTTSILVVGINVQDTNNNAPRFQPSNDFVYTIFTPVAPGITVTGCFDGINVRDIDLTTERIDFEIQENPYFEIAYDAAASTTDKEFIGILRTKTFIRTLPEAITLTITATDVDRTNDPRLSTTATITIKADTEFEFPEEPVFTQAFYLANYEDANQLVLSEPISLQRGFDELVIFSLHGELAKHFELIVYRNQVSVRIVTPLETNVLRENQIFLVVRADREYTSGDSATIVVQLPEEVPLEFERAHYEGTIENNLLLVPQLTLTQGYEGESVTVEVFSEYSSYFTMIVQGNTITLSMAPLTDSIINENNVISLEIVASTEFSSTRTVVSLEIIKDDNVTPIFNKPMYTGSYDSETGLTLEQIVFDQGYDETVELSLEGDHAALFTIRQDGPIITLTTTAISPELFSQQRLLLTLQAMKPRTVGANAAIIITLPAARQLSFEESTYRGTLQDNILSFETIVLSTGYDGNIDLVLRGELASYFAITPTQNRITLLLLRTIPEAYIQENNLIILTVEASGRNAISATTTVLVDIIKEDITTPVFSRNVYYGTYQGSSAFNIENINLAQGYDADVTFELRGDHAEYFQLANTENNVVVSLRSAIPESVIFNEKVLLFNVVAHKPLTVGANAAISIRFPSELTEPVVMRFAQNTYEAAIENDNLRADNIVLSTGYQTGTQFILTGDYSSYFTIRDGSNVLTLSLVNPLPVDVIDSTFIVLEVEARRERAISVWTSIVIDIVKQEVEPLVFTRPYYQGLYDEENEILSVQAISLELGYDENVQFQLEGDLASLFSLTETSSNTLTVAAVLPIPSAVLADNSHLLFAIIANKPEAIAARAAISIDIKRVTPPARHLRFTKDYYIGSIDGSTLTLDAMSLDGDSDDVTYTLSGDYEDYFQLTKQEGIITLHLLRELPSEATESNSVLIFTLEAQTDGIRAHATVILEIINDTSTDKVLNFEEIFYVGSYSDTEGLLFDAQMRINEELNIPLTYSLHGTQAEWFYLIQTENTISLAMSSPIPATILESNHQLVFAIKADSPGFTTARATIVITIVKDHTESSILTFDQVTYVGSIRNTAVTLDRITLIKGFTPDVAFTLHGDLSSYFTLSSLGAGVVGITIPTAIPDQSIPANRLIVLEIRASAPQALTAYATIVFEVLVEDDQPSAPQLVFDATYYTGSYTTAAGLTLNTPIALAEGFDQTVAFALEGDHSQWFSVVQNGNSVNLIVLNSIPAAVLANNAQLLFVITATRPGSETARATIVISLTDEHTDGSILGFDQVTYVGSIRNSAITLDRITLIEGFTQDVVFTLHGDLSSYFTLSSLGAGVVGITIPTAIPDQSIPANRLIVLEIRASAPQALTAYATIVFEVVVEDDQPTAPQLVFDATYYTGSYTTAAGLALNTPIALAEGFDQTVAFALEGDHSQWFSAVQNGNSVNLIVLNSIPAAVLANNAQLLFVITATRPGSETARATIVISLTDEHTDGSILGFDQVTYVGSIRNSAITLDRITLIEGFTQDVVFTLHGDLSSYFTLSSLGAGVVGIMIPTAIPDQSIPANRLIVLEIRASAPQALTAYATIVFEVVVEDDQPTAPQLVFDAIYYTGSYTTAAGLTLNTPIALAEGFDQTVAFGLEGDHSQWFSVVQNDNSVNLIVLNSIPAAVLANNAQLLFVITATRPGSETARATIVISLTDEHTDGSILGFDQVTYVGSIRNSAITLDRITLIEGFTQDVVFTLHGDLSSYFTLSSLGAGVVGITIPTAIPDQSIPANHLIVLEIRASAPQALTAYATIVFEVLVEDDQPSAPQLVFDATYYTGSYTTAAGLTLNNPIALAEGFDQTVAFALEGDHSQWFSVVQNGNSVNLIVLNSIPAAVLANNAQLLFVITATRPGSETARATIVISLTDEHTDGSILGFDQVTYVGSIRNSAITLDRITLIEGFTQDVVFTLHGDLSSYFTLSSLGAGVVGITIPTAIPDQSIPANRLIVLEIRASAPQALTAYATIVFEVVVEDDQPTAPQLVFDATYYTGSYTTAAGLALNTPIALTEGFDQTVAFALEGDHSQWFSVVQNDNSVNLIVLNSIPAAVLANNAQLLFVITATRPGSETARATIVISLTDEHTDGSILGFDQVTYVGSIRNSAITLDRITLIEGFTQDVVFTLHGDLSSYFTLSSLGAGVVGITIPTAIPDQSIPANHLIVLEIRASAPQALTAYATIVFEVLVEDDQPSAPQLVFDATYYTGSYTTAAGLTLNNPIALAEGFDQTVAFALEGDHSQWFSVVQNGNSVNLIVLNSIPAAVLANNAQLLFVITATRPESETARATIVISLTDEHTDGSILGFDQVTYVGSIRNSAITLDRITLIEGFTQDVVFTLHGDLSSYFTLSSLGAGVVGITIPTAIPDQSIPANRLIVLEIRASAPQALTAYATIVFEVVVEDDQPTAPQLVFDATYYTGSYTTAAGLALNTPIALTEGFDQTVAFALEGDHSQWFSVVQNGNSVNLIVLNSIPAAVLANNAQLLFVIAATRPGSETARATIVISLTDEHTDGSILGFDQVTYVGSIRNSAITLDRITLIEGFTQDVVFTLHGDLSSYFTLSSLGAGVVGITIPTAIPDQSIPANRLIVLEIRASAPQALTAYATIVFEVVVEDDQPTAPQLVFDATYYTGSYTTAAGLALNTPIALAEGFDQTVAFALEGDHSQWFSVVQNGNSVNLIVLNSIPAAVLANNAQLLFVITATRPGSETARATIVISLTDEHTDGSILGFDQVTYVGSIRNSAITLDRITLIEGFTQDVVFTLHGDLSSYFTLSSLGAGVVGITIPTAIPDQSIPANHLIVLEIRASAPQALTAYATIVFEVLVEDDQPSAPQLVFDATYYTGSYTTAAGLTLNTPIALAEGFDQTVAFALEGDHSQWFSVVQNGNTVNLIVLNSIPAAVLANNAQLLFVITATRPGSETVRATIVISLTDEHTDGSILGFDQVTYVGSIRNSAITLDRITLIEGFTQDVVFTLHGDLSSYFTLSSLGAGVVGITIPTAIPDQSIPANRLIVLEIRASAPQALTAYATIVFEVLVEDDQPSAPQLVFDATYYTGSYTTAAGLTLNTPIALAEGFDQTVAFALEGDHSQWFSVVQNGNSVNLIVLNSIPAAVLANNAQLLFVITATRPGSETARATIVISLTDEHTDGSILGFDQVTYVGSIRNSAITLDRITLIEGFTQDVVFTLHGDLSSYFTLSSLGAGVVGITIPTAIPDQSIPANHLIVLEIRASAPQALTAYATIVFEVLVEDDQPSAPQLVFDATYYTGSYTTAAGLTLNTPIALAEGFDETVAFSLEGDHSQWFSVVQNGNTVNLIVLNSIPAAVLANNAQLLFVITATRPGSETARATIVISLTDEHTDGSILGFDQVTYVGSIRNSAITLDRITLIEGFTQDVVFTLHGDLSSYFTLSSLGAGVVGITIPTAIPDQSIPANRLIVLEIRASAPQALTAYATIVFEVLVEDDQPSAPQLVFDATYYTGSYTTAAGLTLNTPIALAEGFDQTVAFALEGDHSQWFSVVQNGNSVNLIVLNSIPAAVLANNAQLLFVIAATRPGSETARATIVISLTDEHTDGSILGFDQVTYVGSIRNSAITLDRITLIEGFTQDVLFTLHGDLSSYFTLSSLGAGVVGITIPTAIPDQSIPANRLIVLEIRASAPQALTAYATIVFEVLVEDDQPSAPQLVFDATYYTGSYTTAAGLTLSTPIALAEGFDQTVAFALEGDHSQWFSVVQNGNSVNLIVLNSIPAAVLANNAQLLFVIAATRPDSETARATIVISLTDEHTDGTILGFDQVTYVGSIRNSAITLDRITLIEGFTQDVLFTLHGDLSSYFTLSSLGAGVVGITIPTAIPDQSIPANRLIVLEIRASAPQALTAYATIVFEVLVEDDQPTAPQLVFDATYYTGSYTTAAGLALNTPIALTEGFDQTVAFALEGDHSQWFSVVQNGNSVNLIVLNSIPAAVLANNAQLLFVIAATRPGSETARATIVISLTDEHTDGSILGFDQVTYVGSIRNSAITLDRITLIEGFTQDVVFTLHGDLSSYFTLSSLGAGVVGITIPTAIPDQSIPANRLIVLEIRASAPQALTAYATIVFEVVVEDDQPTAPQLVFDATYYTGSYTTAAGLTLNTPIALAEGFDQTVVFGLEGDHSQWFSVVQNGNSVNLIVLNSIPAAVLANNAQLLFVITATRPGSETARATIVISLTDEHTDGSILGFDQVTYVGSIRNSAITLDRITLIEGFTQDVVFTLHGDLSSYFTLSSLGAGVVGITIPTAIPDQSIPANHLIVLEIRASAPQALTAYATIVFEVLVEDDQPSAPQLVFDATYYTGSYTTAAGLTLNTPIALAEGFDQPVAFALEGDHSQWFSVVQNGNSVNLIVLNSIPAAVLANNAQLLFVITATRPGSETARATIVISLTDEHTDGSILGFDQVTYVGSIRNSAITLDRITLIEGFTQDVVFTLHGDLSSYFTLSSLGAGVVGITIPTAIPDQSIPANRLIVLEIRASAPQALTAYATIVFEVLVEDDQPSAPQLVFDATYYTGSYTTAAGLTLNTPIALAEGFDQTVAFGLEGDHSQWFSVVQNGNSVNLIVLNSIPAAVLANNAQLLFVITATRPGSETARATIVISLTDDLQDGEDVSFEKLVYEGIIQLSTVQHESIIISNYNGVGVQLHGEFSSLFVARVVEGVVIVQASGTLTLPDDVTRVALELHTADARAVLLLTVVQPDVPVLPLVTFSSPSYVLNVEIVQTGIVGRVLATADNGEAVAYSLAIENAHLQARVSINNEGELHLSAPANSGVYSFQVIATTVITQAEGTATVYLTVNAVTVCGDDEIVVPPLIILDRDEEEPHNNLVTLNTAQFAGCRFILTNRWPLNQNWLYVDENGLHARSIDREHESIAFMALSQVQVELILHCESDNAIRTKRSLRTDWLGPYDYGSSNWILTESIPYNARRSLVNLIVNDINDNAPIFVGKELEPIAVGYPTGELEERILPRSLVELQATDADIGLNAALRYWSSEEELAVAPTTGFVHVRSGTQLQNNQRLTVSVTDQNGAGLTGEIQLLVKLLDLSNIVVVTIKDAFLDDEKTVIAQLSNAVGYEVKVLRSVVISDDIDQELSRKKRETSTTGASLLLYVYGLIQREPVAVDRLTTDINNNAAVASVISTVSLEDHLEPVLIPGRDIGLLVATIVLSVLLFIIIVLIAIWYFLRWRKNKNYNAFTDDNSLTSRGSVEQLPKPETSKPRLNLEELKRSEKRLQDMLNSPIEEITVEPLTPRRDAPLEAKVDFSSSEPSSSIVIQSIDKLKDSEETDDDEFGEKNEPRRKSVVTFNENVEKIIHVEDDTDTVSSQSGYEIYKL